MLGRKFFQAESNKKYKLTFSAEPIEDKTSPDQKCITGRLMKKNVPVWKNDQKTNETEEKFVLQLVVDSIDGVKCPKKIWNLKNKKLRDMFRTYAENGVLTDKIFIVEIKGELLKGNYSVVVLDKK